MKKKVIMTALTTDEAILTASYLIILNLLGMCVYACFFLNV